MSNNSERSRTTGAEMTEHDFQCNIVTTLKKLNIFVFAVPNSQHLLKTNNQFLRMKFLSKLKREGFMTGASDLIVLHKGYCFFVEIKSPAEYKKSEKTGKRIIAKAGGTQSEEQKLFQQEVEKEGFPYLLIDSQAKFEEFLNCLQKLKTVEFIKRFPETNLIKL